MNIKISHKMNSRTFVKFGGALLILAVLVGVGFAIVSAASDGFTIDGEVPDAGATVFNDLYGSVAELGPVNGTETKLGVINDAVPPMLSFTNPNAQVDLRKVWFDTNKDASGDVWLYFAWERDSSNGSGVITFEFQKSQPPADCDYSDPVADVIADCNPWANRAADDFIIVWDQKGNTINIIIRTFYLDNGVLKLDAGTTLDSTVSAAKTSTDGYKGEGAINLSKTVFPDPLTECFAYGNVIPGTVTGNSDTADYKDTILDNTIDDAIQVSNCGSIIVKKLVINDNGGTKIATDFKFIFDDDAATSFIADPALPLNNLKGLNTISDLLDGSTHDVVEDGVPITGYTTTYDKCSDIVVVAGESKTCTITNDDTKASPTGATTMHWKISDTLTITGIRSGSPTPAASVTFKLYSESTCTTQVGTDSVDSTIVSGVADSGEFTVGVGTYYWKAVYSGDAYNNGFTTRCGYEVTTISGTTTLPVTE